MEILYIFIEVVGNPPLLEEDPGFLEPITRFWVDDDRAIMGKHTIDLRDDLPLLADDVNSYKPGAGYWARDAALRVPVALRIIPLREPSTFPWGAS